MSEIKIQVEVKIFDDPEFCNSIFEMGNEQESCQFLYKVCDIFKVKCELDREKRRHIKCEQCKALYQDGKETKEALGKF